MEPIRVRTASRLWFRLDALRRSARRSLRAALCRYRHPERAPSTASLAKDLGSSGVTRSFGPMDATAALRMTGPMDATAALRMTGPMDATAALRMTGPMDATAALRMT
jgi:hypothetical protein